MIQFIGEFRLQIEIHTKHVACKSYKETRVTSIRKIGHTSRIVASRKKRGGGAIVRSSRVRRWGAS